MAYKHLKLYKRPSDFMDLSDIDRTQYYVAYGQHRDSELVANHNFKEIVESLQEIQREESESGWLIMRDSHWAVGWVEGIYIHKDAKALCVVAEGLLADLAQYPILNEGAYSDRVLSEMQDYWSNMAEWERRDWCKSERVDEGDIEHVVASESVPEELEDKIREVVER